MPNKTINSIEAKAPQARDAAGRLTFTPDLEELAAQWYPASHSLVTLEMDAPNPTEEFPTLAKPIGTTAIGLVERRLDLYASDCAPTDNAPDAGRQEVLRALGGSTLGLPFNTQPRPNRSFV